MESMPISVAKLHPGIGNPKRPSIVQRRVVALTMMVFCIDSNMIGQRERLLRQVSV